MCSKVTVTICECMRGLYILTKQKGSPQAQHIHPTRTETHFLREYSVGRQFCQDLNKETRGEGDIHSLPRPALRP